MRPNASPSLSLLIISFILTIVPTQRALAQANGSQQPGSTDLPVQNPVSHDENPARAAMEARARLQRQQEQQKKLMEDGAQLAKLSDSLKESLDKMGPLSVSADAIKKAADIEKLAKHIKDQLKNPAQ